ncbi:MAG TPA: PilW family protein [Thermoanaerobaculia bacterium]|nr:PilW family protein [Thermoanaerobaculia bacterium]
MRRNDMLPRRGEAGFTFIEMIVALFVMVEMILAILLLFDFTNKLSRVQTNVTDMQQSLRVSQYDTVRLVRMVGRGPLPIGPLTALPADATAAATLQGIALSVRDNVPAGAAISTVASAPTVVTGTDVLTVRGVFSNPLYQVQSTFAYNPATGTGTITISAIAPNSSTGVNAVRQQLGALVTAVNSNVHEALILVGSGVNSAYAVVELDPSGAGKDVSNPSSFVTIPFKTRGDPRAASFLALSPGGVYPAGFGIASVGILEEYRIYVRSYTANPPAGGASAEDVAAALNSKLSRARMFPNTEEPWGAGDPGTVVAANAANLQLDVADGVIDLQVALGFDSPLPGTVIAPQSISAGTATAVVDTADANDDWLFNAAADIPIAPTLAIWNASDSLYYIRLSTLVRTDRADPKYTAPTVVAIEDNSYTSSPFNVGKNLLFRRRLLQTVIDLRNMG